MSDFVFKSAPMGFERLDAFPFDKTSKFDTLTDAQAYASSPTAYNLQLIGVQDENKPKAYIVYNKQLFPIGGNSNAVVSNETEMLALDVEVGTMVFRTDVGRYYILIADDYTILSNWMSETRERLQWESI